MATNRQDGLLSQPSQSSQVQALPLIAILRGVRPSEVIGMAQVLVGSGFSRIEVPLNSPHAISSIKNLVEEYGDIIEVGAGTVTSLPEAIAVIDAGASLVVTPNYNQEVVSAALAARCNLYCGVLTPSECFAAISQGVSKLKLFPISVLGHDGFAALKSVLPPHIQCYPVGGIQPTKTSMHGYLNAGATGFGLGSELYKPGMDIDTLQKHAKAFADCYYEWSETI